MAVRWEDTPTCIENSVRRITPDPRLRQRRMPPNARSPPASQTKAPFKHRPQRLREIPPPYPFVAWDNSTDGRSPLTLATSDDEGGAWDHLINLEEGEGGYAYPFLLPSRFSGTGPSANSNSN